MMVILNTKLEYNNFLSDIKNKKIFVDIVTKKHRIHPATNSILCIFIKNCEADVTYLLNFSHQDSFCFEICNFCQPALREMTRVAKTTFTIDKKIFTHLSGETDVESLLTYQFDVGLEHAQPEMFQSNYERNNCVRFYNEEYYNEIIPLMKHLEAFDKKYQYYKEIIAEFKRGSSYRNLNGIITETLCDIEKNGLHVDSEKFHTYFSDKNETPVNNFVYSEYNLYTSTGRPSNRYNGINYAALHKEDGSRGCFTSRFGKDGMLITMDYSAYHPRIIANLINFKIDINTNIYDYLGRYYFNINTQCNDLEMKKSKNLTFVNLYGGIREQYKHIPYFAKTTEYINHRWEFFRTNGYVETPIFKRRITSKHITNPSPSKLFNYILQASETEFSIKNINVVNQYLRNKMSKVILYNYDSILLDASKDDGKNTLQEVQRITIDNQFPVKVYVGNNYHNMVQINNI